mmetsp:Transcript_20063/g.43517  ORF Transcript_20063/g.43517 Transcript_20063/m.43517 type:complete len:365 (-) Transcript_20063:139-1233(-)|eukprot:CAMPEP_0172318086 /NCGR_PEP_ID=MMETSP1058-20130122/33813_1 /TAXON_ID=83371 /ORGANISM="Detonula confervacea, Strain CCMP 353" /LENGTH=364 /DNA_ID=CAMNT_0013032817 /DNA_START=77 /DNA_END=1171 /DNA_ORIENTATION=-
MSPPQQESNAVVEATSPMTMTISSELQNSILLAYRSIGLGTFGAFMRFGGMPLEKIALFMNSSQVTGKNQFAQSIKLTFQGGPLAPFRVVTSASMVAWFMQYSVMGAAFQFFDHALSNSLGVAPVWYGQDLMEPPPSTSGTDENADTSYQAKLMAKTVVAPILAGSLESIVANRAEVQRYFGPAKFASIEGKLGWNPVARLFAPAYASNAMRNVIMCNTSFIITPITYKLYFPQEKKSPASLLWYGMGVNFAGNAVAITQQALWGRALDYAAENGGRNINYSEVIRSSLAKEGMAAFITMPKWFSRILMNAPLQGSLPWFYHNVLPMGEGTVMEAVRWAMTPSKSSSNTDYKSEGNGNQTRAIS